MARFDEMSKEKHLEIARKGGLTPKSRPQLTQERCKRGHEMTEDNTAWVNSKRKRVDGNYYPYRYKVCRICQKINRRSFRERNGARKVPEPPKKYCNRGHELEVMGESAPFKDKHTTVNDVELTYKYKRCLACRRENHILREFKKGRTVTKSLKKYDA